MINEEQSYSRLKNNIPAKNIQGDDIEKDRLIENSKGINEKWSITQDYEICHNDKMMLPYWLKCNTNTESNNLEVSETSNGKIKLVSNCTVCISNKERFIKEQEAEGC